MKRFTIISLSISVLFFLDSYATMKRVNDTISAQEVKVKIAEEQDMALQAQHQTVVTKLNVVNSDIISKVISENSKMFDNFLVYRK